MGSVRFLSLGCVVLLLAACGGGGGGGGPRTVGNFTISTSTVTFDGDPGGAAPAPAVVTGSITGVDETVFLTVVLTSNGLTNASVALTGANDRRADDLSEEPRAAGLRHVQRHGHSDRLPGCRMLPACWRQPEDDQRHVQRAWPRRQSGERGALCARRSGGPAAADLAIEQHRLELDVVDYVPGNRERLVDADADNRRDAGRSNGDVQRERFECARRLHRHRAVHGGQSHAERPCHLQRRAEPWLEPIGGDADRGHGPDCAADRREPRHHGSEGDGVRHISHVRTGSV